jgi:hypothetical protein
VKLLSTAASGAAVLLARNKPEDGKLTATSLAASGDPALTIAGSAMGTRGYMSPERASYSEMVPHSLGRRSLYAAMARD